MKKLAALVVLISCWIGLFAAITDIQLEIGSVNTIIGSEVTVPITCSSLTGNGVISYEMDIAYDTSRLDFLAVVKTGTLSAPGMVSVNEVNGALHIAAIFTTALSGQGTLLGLKFGTIFHGVAALGFNAAMMNTTELTNLSGGVVNIENQPVDAGIALENYLQRAGDLVSLSVSVSGVALMNCSSFQFKLGYNPAVISVLGISNIGTVCEGWQLSSRAGDDLIQIAGIGISPLASDGILLNLNVQVLPTATQFSALSLSEVLFNTLSPTLVQNGRLDVYNLWNLQLVNEPDLQNIQNNSPLFTWNTANSTALTAECEFQAGTDGDWSVAELYSSGWQSGYEQQQLSNLTPGSDLFVRLRMRLGEICTDWLSLNGHLVPKPGASVDESPADGQQNVQLQPLLQWTEGVGDAPTGYRIWFGTDNPPSNLADNLDLGLVKAWQPSTALSYNTQYYWRIEPYNSFGGAANCPVWSFRTHDANAIVQFPYLKDFTDGSLTSGAWTNSYTGNVGGNWRINATSGVGGGKCAAAGRAIGVFWYFSPAILCPASGGELSFAIRDYSTSPTYDIAGENIDVLVSTTGLATADFTTMLLSLDNFAVSTAYTSRTCNLNQFAGQAIYLAFRRTANNGNYIFVDNIQISKYTPVLNVSSSLLAFPATKTGETCTANLTLSNTGNGILSGTIIYPNGFSGLGSFSGNSTTVELTFSPLQFGSYNANLQISSSGGLATVALQANAGEEINTCESYPDSGFIRLPSAAAWELNTVQKHSLAKSWTPNTSDAWLISPWMAGGAGKGLGFWAKSNSGGFVEIRYNNSGYCDLNSYQLLGAYLVPSSWTYFAVPFDAFSEQSVSLLLSVDVGVWIDDLVMGSFLYPETPDLQCLQSGEQLELQWLPALNCQSYKVYQSSDLVLWEPISPADYQDCNWVISSPAEHQFFKVSGINGAP